MARNEKGCTTRLQGHVCSAHYIDPEKVLLKNPAAILPVLGLTSVVLSALNAFGILFSSWLGLIASCGLADQSFSIASEKSKLGVQSVCENPF